MIRCSKHRAKDSVFLYIYKSNTGTISVSFNPNSFRDKLIEKKNTRPLKFEKVYMGTREEYFYDEGYYKNKEAYRNRHKNKK